MFRGLPGCGKSTEAEKMVLAAPAGQAVRINRDLLRTMLHADRFKGDKTEKLVVAARDTLLVTAMTRAVPVVISDDTNFHTSCEETFRRLAGNFSYEFEVIDMTDVPPSVCIERDLKRARSVGSKVIMKMYNTYIVPQLEPAKVDSSLPWAVLVDIDGTLAHMGDRGPYDWQRVGEDVLDDVVQILVADAADNGDQVILMSGRDSECRDLTITWLHENEVIFDDLFMRPQGDMRKDSIVKAELFDAHIAGKYNVRYVLDDRDAVVAMWRARGLKVLQVAPGDF